jgi:two-component system phosphate regulon sensor histidine kinase PhoR
LKSSEEKKTNKKLPPWSNQAYYFGVQFPNRAGHLANQMGIWSFSSIVLLLVILFFAYALFVILKQKRLSEIQKDFVNNMTHEFKTPIATISVSAEVLKDPKIIEHPDRLYNYATIIEKENSRLKFQVERVLQMVRLDKEDIGLKKDRIDFHQLIHDSISNATVPIREAGAKVQSVLDASSFELTADRLHLTNVFNNLLDNAIKYCHSVPHILIRTYNQAEGIVMEVIDNGVGIAESNQKKVFEQFYRVPTGNLHDVRGFGLGLSYVRTVVEAHRGRVSVQSMLGQGSTFKVWLPLSYEK